jgi:hypothetical protein
MDTSGAAALLRSSSVAEGLKRLDHHLDPRGDLLDRGGVPVDQVQVHPGVVAPLARVEWRLRPAGFSLGTGGALPRRSQ